MPESRCGSPPSLPLCIPVSPARPPTPQSPILHAASRLPGAQTWRQSCPLTGAGWDRRYVLWAGEGGWRMTQAAPHRPVCPPTEDSCTPPFKFQACGSPCASLCATHRSHQLCQDLPPCQPGCYCPEVRGGARGVAPGAGGPLSTAPHLLCSTTPQRPLSSRTSGLGASQQPFALPVALCASLHSAARVRALCARCAPSVGRARYGVRVHRCCLTARSVCPLLHRGCWSRLGAVSPQSSVAASTSQEELG